MDNCAHALKPDKCAHPLKRDKSASHYILKRMFELLKKNYYYLLKFDWFFEQGDGMPIILFELPTSGMSVPGVGHSNGLWEHTNFDVDSDSGEE